MYDPASLLGVIDPSEVGLSSVTTIASLEALFIVSVAKAVEMFAEKSKSDKATAMTNTIFL